MNELISLFNKVRDIPYRIPLTLKEDDKCCSGKHEKLLKLFKSRGFLVRYRVCVFNWESLPIPKKILKIPHDNDCTHTYLEIKLKKKWVIIDATWDRRLSKILPINVWDGKSNCIIAVKPIRIFSVKKSKDIMGNQTEKLIREDLMRNGLFYKEFNNWLRKVRE